MFNVSSAAYPGRRRQLLAATGDECKPGTANYGGCGTGFTCNAPGTTGHCCPLDRPTYVGGTAICAAVNNAPAPSPPRVGKRLFAFGGVGSRPSFSAPPPSPTPPPSPPQGPPVPGFGVGNAGGTLSQEGSWDFRCTDDNCTSINAVGSVTATCFSVYSGQRVTFNSTPFAMTYVPTFVSNTDRAAVSSYALPIIGLRGASGVPSPSTDSGFVSSCSGLFYWTPFGQNILEFRLAGRRHRRALQGLSSKYNTPPGTYLGYSFKRFDSPGKSWTVTLVDYNCASTGCTVVKTFDLNVYHDDP